MDIQPWDTLLTKLLSTMSTGTGPDVIGVSFGNLPKYAASGYVMDLTPYMKAGTDLDPANWPPALVELLKYEDKYYAAPMNYATLMMYYNKDMFKAAGLDPDKPPADWNSWIDALKKLSKPDQGQYGMAIGEYQTIPNWPIFIWANGGDVIRDGKSALTDPKTVEALKIWSELVRENKISPTGLTGAEADKLFQTQKAAMGITGPWMTAGFTEAGINYDVAPIPTGPGGPVTLADTVVMMVNKSTKNPEAAVKFVQHWNSKESQLYFATQTGFPPARTDLADDPALAKNKWSPKFASVADVSKFYLGGQVNFAQIDTEVFVPMIQSIVLGKQSVEDATKEADAKLNALLQQNP
jgi:multiple sugar transport system substrate-binding protein